MRAPLAALLLAGAAAATPAAAQQVQCAYGLCQQRITPAQLLTTIEALVQQKRFDEARPLIEALSQAPEMKLQSRFLAGYTASEQGDFASAANTFKNILADDPNQTRVRLELARAMLAMGQMSSADRQFKLAEQDGDLPPDVAQAIRGARAVIRSRRAWRLDFDVGFAPDSNINNATGADTINVLFGDQTLPLTLNGDARAKSGTGQTAMISAGLRLPVTGKSLLLVDLDGNGTNYGGTAYDDYQGQLAVGPEVHFSDALSISLQGVGAQRWYGGSLASRQFGARIGSQLTLSSDTRLGLQLDSRHTTAFFGGGDYDGWQTGLYFNAERAVSRTIVASAGLFGRRDALTASSLSSTELGASMGIGGELPAGINFGLTSTVSRAVFDAPQQIFSLDPRREWRSSFRLTLGNRKLRFMGFSPSVSVSYTKNASTLPIYANDRLRWRFALARYF
jgi:hypothetical protein